MNLAREDKSEITEEKLLYQLHYANRHNSRNKYMKFLDFFQVPVAQSKYRPDIDGLRAIAVISVLIFHFKPSWLSGGFVGVDVFFVISGYLITQLIKSAVEKGNFSFPTFYMRRARRLFPAIFFTLATTFIAGSFLFSPTHLERLGGSTIHALLSISNFFFWNEAGYFDSSATSKPLLHFWSLSVEEQFYFIWPSVLVLLLSIARTQKTPLIFIFVTGLGSYVLAQVALEYDPVAAFFLLPFRVVEFAFGATLVWLQVFRPKNTWLRELLLSFGLILLFYSAISYSDSTPFPGYYSIAPCLGTALCIFSCSDGILGKILSNKFFVSIGLISYSLYLCHWPIFVFFQYGNPARAIGISEFIVLLVLSLAVASLMYKFVEIPFRYLPTHQFTTETSAKFALTCAFLAIVLIYPTAHAWANKGWFWRYGSGDYEKTFDLESLRNSSINFNLQNVQRANFIRGGMKVLVVGDSHARDISNGLYQVLDSGAYQINIVRLDDKCSEYLSRTGEVSILDPKSSQEPCHQEIRNYQNSDKVKMANIIVFSEGFTRRSASQFYKILQLTKRLSRRPNLKLIVMDRTIGFDGFHSQSLSSLSEGVGWREINRNAVTFKNQPKLDEISGILENLVINQPNTFFVQKKPLICSESDCTFFLNANDLAIYDQTHWTVKGAKFFMNKLLESRSDLFYDTNRG